MTTLPFRDALDRAIGEIVAACDKLKAPDDNEKRVLSCQFSLAENGAIYIEAEEARNNHHKLLVTAALDVAERWLPEVRALLREAIPAIANKRYKLEMVFRSKKDRIWMHWQIAGHSHLPDYPEIFAAEMCEISKLLATVKTSGTRRFHVAEQKVPAASPEDALQIYLAFHDRLILKEKTFEQIYHLDVVEDFLARPLAESIANRLKAASVSIAES